MLVRTLDLLKKIDPTVSRSISSCCFAVARLRAE